MIWIATLYAVAIAGVIAFQIALIAGAPWGHLTQGGQVQGALPKSSRVIAAVSIPINLCMALAILSAAGFWPNWPVWTSWAALVLHGVVAVLNCITPSRAERRLWAPVTLIILLSAVLIVLVPL
ncbi:MAG: hypothetical protein VXZ18_12145 [Pseudomonadota bacterium]|nr:hypothetical protein [Pseudomonadota bacterium]MEC8581490.1 hypothetical protein [Pseudomonadota bacterium]